MNLNWNAIGAIGEILGALAVFATLIYLSVQMRQNAKLIRGTIREHRTAANHGIQFQIANLIPDKELSFNIINNAMYRDWDTYVRQYNDGLIDEEEWQSQLAIWKHLVQTPVIRKEWIVSGHFYSPELRMIMDEFVGHTESPEDDV